MRGLAEDVTVVVPARGRPDLTQRLLSSLGRASRGCSVILVDDATPQPLSAKLHVPANLRLQVIRNTTNVGPAASRNVGFWSASTPFIAFTDNDVEVAPTWLATLYEHMRHAPDDVAGVGGTVLDDGRNLVGRYATIMKLLDPYAHMGRIAYLVTANCLLRRHALIEVGGFDESFHRPGGEDTDLSFRLLRAGYRLELEPNAVVVHHYDASMSVFFRQFIRYGTGCRKAMEVLAEQPARSQYPAVPPYAALR